jgi:chitodextrinase
LKKFALAAFFGVLLGVLPLAPLGQAGAASNATVRIIHGLPGGPAVDVWIDGAAAKTGLTQATSFDASVTAGTLYVRLAATAVSATQINLTWNASTDNVGVTGYQIDRCQGTGCTTFAQIATSSVTGFSDTGLAASTTYRYRVRATDAAGNVSANSSIVTATTLAVPDTMAPSVPAGLAATAVSATQINLAWNASTDNVAVTGYQLERCQGAGCTAFALIATITGTSFNDTGRTANTSYSYRVRATDAADRALQRRHRPDHAGALSAEAAVQ